MIIQDLEDKYIADCLNIYNYYVENTTVSFEYKKLTLKEFTDRSHRIQKEYPYYIAIENDKVIGFAYLDHYNFREGYNISADLSIYFNKDYLHLGYGKILLNKLIEEAKKRRMKNIVSLITDKNETSIKFHESLGFKQVGYLPEIAIKFNKYQGLYLYMLVL